MPIEEHPVRAAEEARTVDGVGMPTEDRLHQVGQLQRVVLHVCVLHDDDVNAMDHVVRALIVSVPELSAERAAEIMLAAHLHGLADVISCPLERAELYRDRLKQHGLTATIRRA